MAPLRVSFVASFITVLQAYAWKVVMYPWRPNFCRRFARVWGGRVVEGLLLLCSAVGGEVEGIRSEVGGELFAFVDFSIGLALEMGRWRCVCELVLVSLG